MPPKRPRNTSVLPETASALPPNGRNPRLPWKDRAQSEAFAKSLAEFGDLSGVVFNLTTGHLVGGHKRVEAFKAGGDPTITRTHQLESPDASGTVAYGFAELVSGVRFSYREVRWPKEKEAAALLAANKWGAEWDAQALPEMLSSLADAGLDMAITGFNELELASLLEPASNNDSATTAPPTPKPKEARVSSGFEVIAECASEEQQKEIYDLLKKKGVPCRLVTF
ncbi:hypothetical protein UFOVP783_36 [uncultured Caudovirales phage]|uniref:ParB/Sulfiredoxin n=1 Tax=uncultured Caudovirales phage TaxID=2100421 RepID=A0A6J5NSK0_9CAUD|nr:hypothetical protein UFOVP783_36 [uncultured Caudovirales phage]